MGGLLSKKLGAIIAMCVLTVLGLGLLRSSAASAVGPAVSIGSLETGVEFEGKVELEALAIAEPGLGAWTIDVHYDPEVVTLLECGAEHGGLCNTHFAENAVRVTGVSAKGLDGDNFLATLFFGCKKVGSSDLALSLSVFADATPGGPQPIDANLLQGGITCTEGHDKLLGDANCDGEVNAVDATLILQNGAKMIESLPCPDLADVNGDGAIDAIDAAIVLQKVAGLID